MKKIIIFAALAAMVVMTSCSDKIYEEINTDPTKSLEVNPSSQLTFAELETYGHMGVVDMYRLYIYAFTQHLMGCWNTTQYGGCHRADDNEMTRFWYNLYPNAIANLVGGIEATKDDPNQANIHAALRIYKVYMFSLLTDIYGDIPYFEAGKGLSEGLTHPHYDTQEEIYRDFFKELKEAEAEFDGGKFSITSDVIYNGDIEMWKRFSASLRLRFAMRLSKVDPTWAQAEAEDAVLSCFTSASDQALVKHMKVSFSFGEEAYSDFRGNAMSKYFYGNDPQNNPTYICSTFWRQLAENNDPRTNLYCRFYLDDWMSVTSPEGRIDMTEAMMTDRAAGEDYVSLTLPGEFSWDNWPDYGKVVSTSATAGKVGQVKEMYPDWNENENPRWMKPKLATNFLKSENPGVIMTYAEVCFLKAEAASMGWNMGGSDKTFYEEGIREAMNFVTDNYGFPMIMDADYQAYLTQPNIAWDSNDNKTKIINLQAWILHFNNPSEAWANLRRSGYPELASPGTIQTKNPMIDGMEIPVRLLYPVKEASYNKAGYDEVMSRMEGAYNWHLPLWWDK